MKHVISGLVLLAASLLLAGCVPPSTPGAAALPPPSVTAFNTFPATWTPTPPTPIPTGTSVVLGAPGTSALPTGASVPPALAPTSTPFARSAILSPTPTFPAWLMRTRAARPDLGRQPGDAITASNAGRVAPLAILGKGDLRQVVYSPDGKALAAATSQGIYLYDVPTLTQLRFIDAEMPVNGVAFSPDGALVAAGLKNVSLKPDTATVRLWETATGRERRALEGEFRFEAAGVAFSPDGKLLAAVSDGMVRMWEVSTGREMRTLQPHERVSCLAFSPDGASVALGMGNGPSQWETIEVWNVSAGRAVRSLRGHEVEVLSLAFSPNGKWIASGGGGLKVRVWDVESGSELLTLEELFGEAKSVAFSPDGKLLAATSVEGHLVKVWDASTGRETQTLKSHTGPVVSVAFSPNGATLATAARDGSLKIWDTTTWREAQSLTGFMPHVSDASFSPDGRRLAMGGSLDSTLWFWDVTTRRQVSPPPISLRLPAVQPRVVSVVFSSDGTRLAWSAAGDFMSRAEVVEVESGRSIYGMSGAAHQLTLSSDGKYLAGLSEFGQVRLADLAARQTDVVRLGPTDTVHSLAFSPDSKTLAMGVSIGNIRLLDVATGQGRIIATGYGSTINSLAFSPDGKLLAAGCGIQCGAVGLWQVSTGRPAQGPLGRPPSYHGAHSLAFSPDGSVLAGVSGSIEGRAVTLWQVSTGRELAVLLGHLDEVSKVAFSPVGRLLATASGDGTVWLWGVPEP